MSMTLTPAKGVMRPGGGAEDVAAAADFVGTGNLSVVSVLFAANYAPLICPDKMLADIGAMNYDFGLQPAARQTK